MSRPERQQNVLELLKALRGLEPLKQLFWRELNYQRVNQPLSSRGWTEINERVARLYGLTPEEIKIVEDSAK